MAGPTIVQSNSTILSNGGAVTSPLAFTNPVTAGNLIVVFWAGSSGIGNTVTDNNSPLSNVYTINEQNLGGDHGIVAYAVAGSSQALTVTVGNAGGLTPAYFAIVEVANWVSVDSVTNQGLAVVADPFTFNDTANFSNDLAIGMCSVYANGQTDTFGVGGGWNVLQNTVAGTLEYATVASGTVTFDFTTSATYRWGMDVLIEGIQGYTVSGSTGVSGTTVSWTGTSSGSTTSGAGGAFTTAALAPEVTVVGNSSRLIFTGPAPHISKSSSMQT